MNILTKKQKETLAFIKAYMKKHDIAPTAAEIASGIGISSRGVAHRYLKALADSGVITLVTGRHRNIIINEGVTLGANHPGITTVEPIPARSASVTPLYPPSNVTEAQLTQHAPASNESDYAPLPLLGCIAAGLPIEAVDQHATVDVYNIFSGNHRYALKVKGDSMIDEGIFDGDIVICEHAKTARNGQIVVALIDQEEATLKRIKQEPGTNTVTLLPANANYAPMAYPAERVTIQGIYIGLVRMSS